MDPNSQGPIVRRLDGATLTWHGPALMRFARAACPVGAQALVATVFALRSSPTPWHDAEPWLPKSSVRSRPCGVRTREMHSDGPATIAAACSLTACR
jgi:hypothetical protein